MLIIYLNDYCLAAYYCYNDDPCLCVSHLHVILELESMYFKPKLWSLAIEYTYIDGFSGYFKLYVCECSISCVTLSGTYQLFSILINLSLELCTIINNSFYYCFQCSIFYPTYEYENFTPRRNYTPKWYSVYATLVYEFIR